eukprot:scaffold270382_cov59-Attheya_sp.AAC.1
MTKYTMHLLFITISLDIVALAYAGLINPGFEELAPGVQPVRAGHIRQMQEGDLVGWKTTASDKYIEVWKDGFLGVPAFEGEQFVELNAKQVSTLYQDQAGIPKGAIVSFKVAHRSRQLDVEQMNVAIVDLGPDGEYGTSDDTTLFSKTFDGITSKWTVHTSVNEPDIIAKGNKMRFKFESTGYKALSSVGNLIDDADFGIDIKFPSDPPSGAPSHEPTVVSSLPPTTHDSASPSSSME